MTRNSHQTRELILNSATAVFTEKGYDGARMQEIADRAGINKALVHYYFTGKKELFKTVFSEMMGLFIPHLIQTVTNTAQIREKVGGIIDMYVDFFSKNSFIPVFIIREMTNNPSFFSDYLRNKGLVPDFIIHVLKDSWPGSHDENYVRHMIVDTISLCIFPIAAKPVLKEMLFDGNESRWEEFIQNRKTSIRETIYNAYNL